MLWMIGFVLHACSALFVVGVGRGISYALFGSAQRPQESCLLRRNFFSVVLVCGGASNPSLPLFEWRLGYTYHLTLEVYFLSGPATVSRRFYISISQLPSYNRRCTGNTSPGHNQGFVRGCRRLHFLGFFCISRSCNPLFRKESHYCRVVICCLR